MTSDTDKKLWFRAKTYGYGWGLPLAWQGWVVYAIYFSLLAFGIFKMSDNKLPVSYFLFFLIITAALVLICYLKGEKPRWRWGK